MELNASVMNSVKKMRSWPSRPGLAFIWAAIWMLREIELRNMLTSHVTLNQKTKSVTIWLPISKTDQSAGGVRRTLGCCRRRTCSFLCPWKLATKVLSAARKPGVNHALPLFSGDKVKTTTKSAFIAAWKHMFSEDVSGHSPRRSGAMYYVRNNVPIQELAFLGRWRSSVVLSYAEEALQEKPLVLSSCAPNVQKKSAVVTTVEHLEEHSVQGQVQGPDLGEPQSHPEALGKKEADPTDEEPQRQGDSSFESLAQAFSKPRDLWVVTKGRGSKQRPAHRVTKACWSLPIKEWSTACGWLFAEKSAECSLLPKLKDGQVVCNKCRIGFGATSQGGSKLDTKSNMDDKMKSMDGKRMQHQPEKPLEGGRVAARKRKLS